MCSTAAAPSARMTTCNWQGRPLGRSACGELLATDAICRMSAPRAVAAVTFSMPRFARGGPAADSAAQAKGYQPGALLARAARFQPTDPSLDIPRCPPRARRFCSIACAREAAAASAAAAVIAADATAEAPRAAKTEAEFAPADSEVGSECSTADTAEGQVPSRDAAVPAADAAPGPLPAATTQAEGPMLRLIGTAWCPTMGSSRHALGTCKPCAFVFKDGCNNGVECQFCHLCCEGEKRRRKREAKARRRVAA